MESVAARIRKVQEELASACQAAGRSIEEVSLVAVSKRQPDERVAEAYETGIRDFGENTLQGLQARIAWADAQGLKDIRWHFIGQIQSRKLKSVWGQVFMIHTMDRAKLVDAASRMGDKAQASLVQVNIGSEVQKGGVEPDALPHLLESCVKASLEIRGLMCIPPNDGTPERWFEALRRLGETMSERGLLPRGPELSMGMSSDFVTAVGYGATLVRVGSSLFGERKIP